MIASAFPQGSGWGWEVLGRGGQLVANGLAPTAEQARHLSTRAWLDATGPRLADLADAPPGQVRFGGTWGR